VTGRLIGLTAAPAVVAVAGAGSAVVKRRCKSVV
jgi:hypothetical protein